MLQDGEVIDQCIFYYMKFERKNLWTEFYESSNKNKFIYYSNP